MKSIFVVEHEHVLDGDELFAIETVLQNMYFGSVVVCVCVNQAARTELMVPNVFPDGQPWRIPMALQEASKLKKFEAKAKMKAAKKSTAQVL